MRLRRIVEVSVTRLFFRDGKDEDEDEDSPSFGVSFISSDVYIAFSPRRAQVALDGG